MPSVSPMGKDDIINAKTKNIRLYVKRVFISSDFDGELVWEYFSLPFHLFSSKCFCDIESSCEFSVSKKAIDCSKYDN